MNTESMPPIPLMDVSSCLLGSIQYGLHDRRAIELGHQVLDQVQRRRPLAIILDFSAIPIIDSFLSKILLDTVIAVRLLGSRVLLCGLPDAVIVSMVELGIIVPSGTAVRDVDTALEVVHAAV